MEKQRPLWPAPVASLPERRERGILETLEVAFDDHARFTCILIAVRVKNDDGTTRIEVSTANMNRFERIGLAEEAKQALLDD